MLQGFKNTFSCINHDTSGKDLRRGFTSGAAVEGEYIGVPIKGMIRDL